MLAERGRQSSRERHVKESQDYFRSGHSEDAAEVRRTVELIGGALKVFQDRFADDIGGWPYSASAAPGTTPQFSNSTNAMISFALLATMGGVERSVLLPLRPFKPLNLNHRVRFVIVFSRRTRPLPDRQTLLKSVIAGTLRV